MVEVFEELRRPVVARVGEDVRERVEPLLRLHIVELFAFLRGQACTRWHFRHAASVGPGIHPFQQGETQSFTRLNGKYDKLGR
ncbi:hypothetical protein DAETH_03530 [Deinococcus aetherius]|uniref:Uncharacterized protein n=1 Tax=Deinococcus aetherius TaxID=200252 RepID=A0ABN6RBR9_9DEIO|nr:hypothetical protein DAETH_03530 [Deinococcus aetherius]